MQVITWPLPVAEHKTPKTALHVGVEILHLPGGIFLTVDGHGGGKKIREAEEKAKARKNNILYGVIAGVFVLVAAALLVWNSGVLQRNAAALSIDGEKYSASQVNYFYHSIKNNILNGSYSSLYGVSSSTPLDQQVMNDTAKMFLGVEDEGEVTWAQFIHDYAIKQMTLIVKEAKEAEANGHGADDHTEEEVASTIEQYTAYAKENGYSLKEYLKLAFGKTMTVSTFKDMIRLVDVASHYASEYSEELSYTASDLESYYNDNKSSFNVASYESLYFKGTADSTTDADGNTVAPTDEENAAAKEKAIADADAALKLYQAGDPLETVSLAYESAAYSNTEAGSNSGDEASEWLFDESRADGDSTVITTDSGSRVLVFHSAGRQEYASRDVRHILFMADTTGLDSKSETYEADLQAAKDAAKAKAEKAPVRKRTVGARKAAAPEVKLYVQYQGKQISQEEAVEAVKAAWTGEPIKSLELYVKPEDGAIYYVINGSETGKVTF